MPKVDVSPTSFTSPRAALTTGLIGLAVATCLGGLALAFAKRRRPSPVVVVEAESRSRAGWSPAGFRPEMAMLDDPLLAAIAKSATERTGRVAAPSDTAARTPAWVRRLDADINNLSDEASRRERPPSREGPNIH